MNNLFKWHIFVLTLTLFTQLPAQNLRKINTLICSTSENYSPGQPFGTNFVRFEEQLYSFEGKLLLENHFSRIEGPKRGLCLACAGANWKNAHCGYLSPQGRLIVPLIYADAEAFDYPQAAVSMADGTSFLIDTLGQTVAIPGKYEEIQTMEPGLFRAENKDGKKGVILADGRIKIPFEYGEIYKVSNRDFYEVRANKWIDTGDENEGMVNGRGKVIIPIGNGQRVFMRGDFIGVFLNGIGDVFYDTLGNQVADPEFEEAPTGNDRYVYKKKYGNTIRYGLLDSRWQPITPLDFSSLCAIDYGLFMFTESGFTHKRFGILNNRGEKVITFENSVDFRILSSDDILVRDKRGRGYWFNRLGRQLLPDTIPRLSEYFGYGTPGDTSVYSVLAVSLGGKKYGLYGRNGQPITTEQYDTLYYLTRDKVIFRENRQYGVLDSTGRILVPARFDEISLFKSAAFQAILPSIGLYSGLISFDGRELLPIIYNKYRIVGFGDRYVWAKRDKDWEIFELK